MSAPPFPEYQVSESGRQRFLFSESGLYKSVFVQLVDSIDYIMCSTYPTNNDIRVNNIAVRAYGEAESLFALLGVTASDLFYESAAPARLPAIGTWLIEDIDELFGQDDSELGINDIGTSDSGERTDDYQLALDLLEDADDDVLPQAKKDQLKGYRYASIALSIEERAQM